MLSLADQISAGKLVRPETHERLIRSGDTLVTPDGARSYPCADEVLVMVGAEDQGRYRREHLEHPEQAAREMLRTLKPGGQVFCQTPFLQAFHTFPNHFQNFTLEGHNRLFQRCGFEPVDSGAAVGPTWAVRDLISVYIRAYTPGKLLSRVAQKLFLLVAAPFRPLDRFLFRSPDAHRLASTVFAHLRKP